jgi:hypothetical protein
MVLVAATAVGLAWFQSSVVPIFGGGLNVFQQSFLEKAGLFKLDIVFNHVLPPFLASWGVALFALKRAWRRPLRHLVTKPGTAACSTALLGLIYSGLWIAIAWFCGGRNVWYNPWFVPLLLGSFWSGTMLIGVWLTLMLSGVAGRWWRDADWKEWCGVAIGCCWIVGLLITHAIHFAL